MRQKLAEKKNWSNAEHSERPVLIREPKSKIGPVEPNFFGPRLETYFSTLNGIFMIWIWPVDPKTPNILFSNYIYSTIIILWRSLSNLIGNLIVGDSSSHMTLILYANFSYVTWGFPMNFSIWRIGFFLSFHIQYTFIRSFVPSSHPVSCCSSLCSFSLVVSLLKAFNKTELTFNKLEHLH